MFQPVTQINASSVNIVHHKHIAYQILSFIKRTRTQKTIQQKNNNIYEIEWKISQQLEAHPYHRPRFSPQNITEHQEYIKLTWETKTLPQRCNSTKKNRTTKP